MTDAMKAEHVGACASTDNGDRSIPHEVVADYTCTEPKGGS